MPKMKTHRGAAKRFKKNAGGKISRARANKQHILTKKASKRKRRLRHTTLVSKVDEKRVQHMLSGV